MVRVLSSVRVTTNSVDYDHLTIERAVQGTSGAEHAYGSQFMIVTKTHLSAGISASDTECTFHSAPQAGIKAGSYVQVGIEIMQVTGLIANRATITRGLALTTATSHSAFATVVVLRVTLSNSSSDLSATDDSLIVVNASSIRASVGMYVGVENEVMRVNSVSEDGKVLNVQRGAAGTSATSHRTGLPVSKMPTTVLNLLYDGFIGEATTKFPVKSAPL